jgi:hypothetical protein
MTALVRHRAAGGEDRMSDIQKKDSQHPPTASRDDDDIIELVEEIGEESPPHPLSDLERKLLDIDGQRKATSGGLADLPDLADLDRIDFEEEEDEGDVPGQGIPAAGTEDEASGVSVTADADRLFEPDVEAGPAATGKRPVAPLDDVEEIAEFDEQFLDAEDLLEGQPTPAGDNASGEDEDLELLDIDEDDGDDEIVWFDDLDKLDQEAPSTEPAPEEAEPVASLIDTEAESMQATSAADVFAAHVETALADAGTAARQADPVAEPAAEPTAPAQAAPLHAPVESPPGAPPPAMADATPPAVPGLAPEEIEAAVERVMARKLGGTIEAIILQAIEKAVSKEIERLKSLLLEDEAGDRKP